MTKTAKGELPRALVERAVEAALEEDLGGAGDITTDATIPIGAKGEAAIVAREAGVIAGLDLAAEAFLSLDPEVKFQPLVSDGDAVKQGAKVARIAGKTRAILAAERTALNFLGHLSGVATLTSRYVEAVAGTGARIACTRKTTPGLRALEKYAVPWGRRLTARGWRRRADQDNHSRLRAASTTRFARVSRRSW
jgi:nicotinate-nucleotide pyrophosphorylase (carboxylating)